MPPNVLVVDGDQTTLEQLCTVLMRGGFDVVSTNDGFDALSRFLESPSELVVLDNALASMSAEKLCTELRDSDSKPRLVFVCGAEVAPAERDRMQTEVGVDVVLDRPFRLEAIRTLLERWGLAVGKEEEVSAGAELDFGLRAQADFALAGQTGESAEPEAESELLLDDVVVAERAPGEAGARLDAGRTVLPPSVARVGDLGGMPLPRLIFELYASTYSGIVRLKRKGAKRAIYFWAGMPVRVDSEGLEETLGMMLKEQGRIDEDQYDAAQAHAVEASCFFGQALVGIGAMRESEVLNALREQTERKLVNSFAWRDGTYSIEDDTSFAENAVFNEVHPIAGIFKGVAENYDLGALLEYFARLRTRYVVTTPLFAVHQVSLASHLGELDLAPVLNGKNTFEEALRSDDARGLELAQALYVLLVTDMIRPSGEPGAAAPTLDREKAIEPEPALADYGALMEAADRIAREYMRAKAADCFALFEIARDATADGITEAFEKKVSSLRADVGLAGLPRDAQKRAKEIGEILGRARSLLSDPERRAAYLGSLPPEEGEPGVTETGATDDQGGEVDGSKKREALIVAEQTYKEGVRLMKEAKIGPAYEKLQAAVKGNPREPTYRVALAQVSLEKFAEFGTDARGLAYSHIEVALRQDPGHLFANLEAARVLIVEEMRSEARVHLSRVLQRAPNHKGAQKMLAELGEAA